MKPAIGEIMRSTLNGEEYVIKKIIQNMAILESQNGRKQIITEVDSLSLFYKGKEEMERRTP